MKNVFTSPKIYMLGCLLIIVVTASAWQLKTKKQPHDSTQANITNADTTHPGKPDTVEDDYGLNGLNESLKQLDGLDTTIEQSVRTALASINFEEIGRQAKEAVDKIDWQQIKTTVDNSIREAQKQVQNIDWDAIRQQVKDATDKIDSKEFKEQFNSANLQKIIDDAMQKVNDGLKNINPEISKWKDFTDELEKDGLIDKSKGYKIEWDDDGELFINGKKQSKETADKFRQYFKKGGYTIKHDGDDTESL
ncbi:MAG TPA: hypothetical protein VG738_03935 [Chitinophagaceae bacterium]|nr:hypothetical protein [Chitinophagaceae bacterium]